MPEPKVKISAVRYANTYPFLYGIKESNIDKIADICTDHPADCARKLINGTVDIGLVPVASLLQIPDYRIITDFCLGAYGDVQTVMLLSYCDMSEIETIYLDYRSMSSITLIKILAKNAWHRDFIWKSTSPGFDFLAISSHEAVVLIGDQCIEYSPRFSHKWDLAGEWYSFTGLPFAFACWTSNKEIDPAFIDTFNKALAIGVNNLEAVVERYGHTGIMKEEKLLYYLTRNMDYFLNESKREAIKLFLDSIQQLENSFLT